MHYQGDGFARLNLPGVQTRGRRFTVGIMNTENRPTISADQFNELTRMVRAIRGGVSSGADYYKGGSSGTETDSEDSKWTLRLLEFLDVGLRLDDFEAVKRIMRLP